MARPAVVSERNVRHAPRPELMVLGAALLFGTTGTAQALGPDLASPATVGAARLVVGGAALALIAVARGGFSAVGGRLGTRPTVLAAAGVALYQVTFFAAVARTGVALGTVVALGSAPVATGGLALVLRRGRTGSGWRWLSPRAPPTPSTPWPARISSTPGPPRRR